MFMIGDKIITNVHKRGAQATERINEVLKHDDEIERGGTKRSRRLNPLSFKDFNFTYPVKSRHY